MEKFQNVMLLGFSWFQQEPFINDQQDRVGIFPLDFLVCAIVTCYLQFQEQIRKPYILRFVTLLACFHPERTCQIGLAAPGCACDKEIPVLCDIFTCCEPLDQCPVQLAAGSIVDITNVCVRLVESGVADQAFQAVALSVAVFDIYQHPEAILERYFFHFGIRYLSTECIRHSCQAHFNEFIHGALCSHSSLPPVVISASCKRMAALS